MSAPNPTILLHVSDLHGRRPWFDWIAAQAEKQGWGVAISGDMLNGDAVQTYAELKREIESQKTWIKNWVRAVRFPLFICSGNHDVILDEDATWLRGLARPGVTVNGCGHLADRIIAFLPWACGPEAFLTPQTLAADIWLHHQPPAESGLSHAETDDAMDFGSDNLVAALSPAWMANTRLVLSGHVHTSKRWHAHCGQALCFNVAPHDFSTAVPRHIIIDLGAGTAVLNDDDQRERVSLQKWA